MFNTFSKSDLKIGKNFQTPFQPHAPKKVQDKYWAEYSKYLDSLNELDSARMDYKHIKVSLWVGFIVAVLCVIGLLGTKEFVFTMLLLFEAICIPIILHEFFKIRKNLKEQLSKHINTINDSNT